MFDVHLYPPRYLIMEYYKVISSLMKKIPMYVGEFNAGIKKGVSIDGRRFKEYIKRLKHFNVYGGAFWKWSYIVDNDHPAFNLAIVINDKIYPNSSFESLVNDGIS